jgi:arylsulfatase B
MQAMACSNLERTQGKWHMGSDIIDGPNNHGFDESYGSMPGVVGMYDHRYREGKYEKTWHRNQKPIEGGENGTHVTTKYMAV